MKRRAIFLMIVLALGVCALPACHAPVTVQTEAGKIAFTADQIAIRVGELQNAAIAAEASGGLSTSTTRVIVTFCVSSSKVLQKTPAGWQQTVSNSWLEVKKQIPAAELTKPAIAATVSSVDVVLAAYLGGN